MEPDFDVFVSYSSADRQVVETIAEQLRHARLTPWFDRWNLTAGRSWQQEIAAGIAASGACAVCVGPGDLGDWSREELQVALARAANDPEFRVFVVLLPGLPEPLDPSQLSPFLTTRTWVDLRAGTGDLQPLINAVMGVSAGGGDAPPEEPGSSPYRGLRPFEEDDADVFFGREAETQRALEKLKATRFLAVVGASGSGKSSLVRAGLIPAIRRGALPASARWSVRVFKPGPAPLDALAAHLVRVGGNDDVGAARARLRDSADALHLSGLLALVDRPEDERIVLVVDQFEEVFTRCRDDAERRRFIESLVYAATAPGGRIVVVLTLRADFYPRCAAHPELSQLLSSHQTLIGPMAADALRRAIVEPARRAGGEFQAGLVALLVEDVSGRPGSLPLLEHALFELWRRRRGRVLTLEAYQRTGGVAGAVAQRAEEVFTALDDSEQAIARRVLLRLTEPGEGTEDTRRRADFDELARSGDETAAVGHVVGELADARLLTTTTEAAGGGQVVDVSHEALIRGWPRLRGWIDEDREGLRIHRRVTETADEWERLAHDDGLLFRGARLAEALAWRAHAEDQLNARERAFLDASAEALDRERREAEERREQELAQARALATAQRRAALRLRWVAAVLVLGVAATTAGLLAALRQRDRAESQTAVARDSATLAISRQLAAQAREAYETRVDDALLRSLAAVRLKPATDTQAALLGALLVDHRLGAMLRSSGPEIVALAGSREGRTAVSVDASGALTRWDLERRRPSDTPLPVARIAAAGFSGDLGTVATGSEDGWVQVWDVRSRRPLTPAVRMMGTERIAELHLSGAGRHLLALGEEGHLSVWTVASRLERVRWLRPSGRGVLAFSRYGERIGLEEAAGVVIRDLGSRRVVARVGEIGEATFDFTADGRHLIGGNERYSLHDRSGRMIRPLPFDDPRIVGSPDGELLAGLDRGSLRLADTTGSFVDEPLRGLDLANGLAAFAGGDRLVTAAPGGRIALWELDAEPALASVWPLAGVGDAALRADGRELVVGDYRQPRVRLFDAKGRIPGRDLAVPPSYVLVSGLAFSPNGRLVAGIGHSQRYTGRGTGLLWDRRTAAPLVFGGDEVSAIAFDPSGSSLAVGGDDGSLAVWDLTRTGPVRRSGLLDELPSSVAQLQFDRDGRSILVVAGEQLMRVDIRTRRRHELLRADTVAVTARGDSAAIIDDDGDVSLVSLVGQVIGGPSLTRVDLSATLLFTLAPTSNGQWIAVDAGRGAITIWDRDRRTKLADLRSGTVDFMEWSGERLVTYADGRFVTWDFSLASMRRRACAIANRNYTRAEWLMTVGPGASYARLC